jgi:LasA protease
VKKKISPQVTTSTGHLRISRGVITCLICGVLFLVFAQACNLPARQTGGLIFPADQPRTATSTQHLQGHEATLFPIPTLITPTASYTSGEPLDPFHGLQTATPELADPGTWVTPGAGENTSPFSYWTQPGDTLVALAKRFNVSEDQITPSQPSSGLLLPGQQLTIPNVIGESLFTSAALPDSAVIYSPLAAGFQTEAYVMQVGGFLSTYNEHEDGQRLTGAEIVQRVALESSINPQLLLAFLQFRSGWVLGEPVDPTTLGYPIGFHVPEYRGLYLELSLVAKELNIGYYGWRDGSLTELVLPDYTHVRLDPTLNAGSVAAQLLTSLFYRQRNDWLNSLYGPGGLLEVYGNMFGDPWQAAASVEPLFPAGLSQPALELPFAPGEYWSLTSGPHISWCTGTPRGALDFAPITGEPPCAVSATWITASAAGVVIRSDNSIVVLDLDGDGYEQTGWVLVYMHVAEQGRVPAGTWVEKDTPLGHPSCEGGQATGTHVHIARKFNGEWLAANGPIPFMLSGWVAHAGQLSYEGTLEKDGKIVSAHPDGTSGSTIIR